MYLKFCLFSSINYGIIPGCDTVLHTFLSRASYSSMHSL